MVRNLTNKATEQATPGKNETVLTLSVSEGTASKHDHCSSKSSILGFKVEERNTSNLSK
jgi:hypothetical protein